MRTVGLAFSEKEEKKPRKKEVMEILDDRGIEYDENAKLDELIQLLHME